MSGAAVITPINTFAGQVGSISLSLLDTNFTQITAFLNNPNNYTNYLVDSGAANSYVVTFPTGLTPTYTAGLAVVMKVTNANTGASQINVNSLGLKNITKQGTTALSLGDLTANSIVMLIYDGTQFQLASGSGSGTVASGVIYENSLTISSNYTITTSKNAHSVGPITIASGVTLTVPTGSRYVVL